MTVKQEFWQEEAVPLSAALVAHIAERRGLRCLIIKGPAAVAAGMRPARPSADTDVLVHPADFEALCAALAERGWESRPFEDGVGTPKHSVTLYHPQWPTDLDVHFRFPGLDADEAASFEALARAGTTHGFAGRRAPVPDVRGHFIIQATHAIRNVASVPFRAAGQADFDHLVARPDLPAWSELLPLIEETGSLAALEPILRKAYPESSELEFPPPSEDWLLRNKATLPGAIKMHHLLSAPWRDKWSVLARSLAPSVESLAASDLALRTADDASLALRRRARLGRFLRQLPATSRQVLEIRRATRRRTTN